MSIITIYTKIKTGHIFFCNQTEVALDVRSHQNTLQSHHMSIMAYHIIAIVWPTACSHRQQRKHQASHYSAFVCVIPDCPHEGPVIWELCPCHGGIMTIINQCIKIMIEHRFKFSNHDVMAFVFFIVVVLSFFIYTLISQYLIPKHHAPTDTMV